MNKYQLLHSVSLIFTGLLLALMLTTRLDGRTGQMTDLAMLILAAIGVWHVVALRRLDKR